MDVPLFDTETPLRPLRSAIQARVAEVIERGVFILGPEVKAFEREFADYLGVRHVVGVANGTDAITIALRALDVRPGDEVVVPSFTFYASVEAIVATGAHPIFCDVDAATKNISYDTVKSALTGRTRAIVAVDLFGSPAPVPDLRAFGIPILEDAAQAAGATLGGRRTGALGDAATFSFYPSKNLGCFGDGGAIATDDDHVADVARMLRFHGSRDKQTFEYVGYNSRLDEIQAAVLRVLLPELDGFAAGRRAAARAYEAAGLGEYVTLPVLLPGAEAAWHLYVVEHARPDAIAASARELGIQMRRYYQLPIHRQPAMRPFVIDTPPLPVTDELAARNLALPISPVLDEAQARAVVGAVATAAA